jgi:hypothetical protein
VTAAGVLLAVALTCQYLLLRPAVRARAWTALYVPLCRRWRCARRSLAALTRAALLKPYRGHHAPRRTQP